MSQRKQLAGFLFLAASALPGAAQLGACGDDGVNHLPDAPHHIDDAAVDAAPTGPRATYATTVAFQSTCGDLDAPTQTFTITNPGTEALVISNYSLTGDTDFHVTFDTSMPVTIAPGASGTLMLTAPRAVVGTDLPAATKTTSLQLVTNLADPPPAIALTMTVHGAALAFTDGGGTALAQLALTSATSACPAPLATFLKNTGDQAITATGGNSGALDFASSSASGALAPGATLAISFTADAVGSCQSSDNVTVFIAQTAGLSNLCNGDSSGAYFIVPASFTIAGSSCFCS